MALLSRSLKLLSSSSSGTAAGNCIFSTASAWWADLDSSMIVCAELLLSVCFCSPLTLGLSYSAGLSSSSETSKRLSSSRSRIWLVEFAAPAGTADGDPLVPCILTIVLRSVDEFLLF